MAQTNINIRMDADLKMQAEDLFNELGLNMTSVLNDFVRQVVRQRKLPFELSAETYTDEGELIREGVAIPKGEENDPFYSAANLRDLQESIRQIEEGKVVVIDETYTDEDELIREGFTIPKGEENDPFYSAANLRVLQESMRQAEEGKFVKVTTLEELLAMAESA
jgi:DNA-damage-inducible protein J